LNTSFFIEPAKIKDEIEEHFSKEVKMTKKMFRYAPIVLSALLFSVAGMVSAAGGKETVAAKSKMEPGPWGRYEPGITLSSVRFPSKAATYPPGDDQYNNVWTRDIKEKFGIDIKYDWVVEEEQYQNKINLTLASGDLPDFFGAPSSHFLPLAKSGQLADLTEVYEKYASPELKAAQMGYEEGFKSGIVNGKLYGISIGFYGYLAEGNMIWIRSDWLTKYNLKAPKTMDELVYVAETFMKNGAAFGISVSRELYGVVSSLTPMANGFHVYPRQWMKDKSGNIVYGSIQPEMKAFLGTLAKWYQKGIISKEFGVKDEAAANEDLVSGRVGISFGQQWNGWYPYNDLVKNDPSAIFKPYPTPSSDGNPVWVQVPWPISMYWVVSKDCPYPEAMIKLANLYVKYHWNSDSIEQFQTFIANPKYDAQSELAPLEIVEPRYEYNLYKAVRGAIVSGDVSKLDVQGKNAVIDSLRWRDKKDSGGFGRYSQMGPGGSYDALKDNVENNRWVPSEIRGPEPDAWARNKAILEKLEADTVVRIITGDASIDQFDKFVQDWYNLGGKTATEEINSLYRK